MQLLGSLLQLVADTAGVINSSAGTEAVGTGGGILGGMTVYKILIEHRLDKLLGRDDGLREVFLSGADRIVTAINSIKEEIVNREELRDVKNQAAVERIISEVRMQAQAHGG